MGAGLPAIAIYQQRMCWLTHRYRRQASSHRDCISGPLAGLDDHFAHSSALPQVIDRLGGLFQRVYL